MCSSICKNSLYLSNFIYNNDLKGGIEWDNKISEKYKEFLQKGSKLINSDELKKENIRKRLCLLHSFVNKWINDKDINERIIRSEIKHLTYGLPFIVCLLEIDPLEFFRVFLSIKLNQSSRPFPNINNLKIF